MLVAVAALSACSSPYAQKEHIVRQYFRASGLRDNQTLANLAVVSFDPKVEGVVTDFDVTAVSPERSEPLQVIELSKFRAVTEAEAENKARPVAELSLTAGNGDTPAIEEMDGNLVSQDVSVAATVRGPDGATTQKNYLVTVQRAVVKGANGERNGKWVITAVKPA